MISQKYKNTEVGIIPEDWEVKRLSELGKFSKGSGVRKDEALSGDIPCVRYGELYTRHSDYIKQFYSFISKDISETAKKLKAGDILFAGSGETKEEIGKSVAFIDDFEAYAGGDIVILSPINTQSLYLGYLLNAPFIQKQKANRGQGDAVVHISATQLGNVSIPLPPTKAEQTAIATALSDADALISSLEKIIAKKRNIKRGAMQKLLQPKEGWEVKKLGEVCENIGSGKSKTQSKEGKFPIFGSTGIIGWSSTSDYFGHKILVARVGANAGTVNIVDGNYCVSDNTLIVSLNPEIDLNFIYSFLILFQLNKLVFGSGQPLITGGQLKNIEISIPKSKSEQTHIANILSDVDNEITTLETKLEKYRKVKLGMMQNLLTGKIRLV
jgi:type I restriction enzyme, S subunit